MNKNLMILCVSILASAATCFTACAHEIHNAQKEAVLDALLANTTHHIFNVEKEHFLVSMAREQDQLVYRAFYPFTVIEQAGVFKLSTKVTGSIAIQASDVQLDLNGNTVTGGITIESGLNRVTVKNGTIDTTASSALSLGVGCTDIELIDLTVRNAASGISCNQVSNVTIRNCDLTSNSTGLEIANCANVLVENCRAVNNTHIGYDLVQSSTCTLLECQAINTGEGNAGVVNQTIVGFRSQDGYGNIFERCIANSTQALSTTDFDSVVAGFVLQGSEGCSKIIECQASNAITSNTGFTMPHGIFLEASIINPMTLTGVRPLTNINIPVWSPDGNYVAVTASSSSEGLFVYEFDRKTGTLFEVDSADGFTSAIGISWSPSGQFIAVSDDGADTIRIYRFDGVQKKLKFFAEETGLTSSSLSPVSWHPSEQYIAFAQRGGSVDGVVVYQFNPVSGLLTFADSSGGFSVVSDVAWSPDGTYVLLVAAAGNLHVFPFDFDDNMLGSQIDASPAMTQARGGTWSPNGRYIALANTGSVPDSMNVYEFDKQAGTLTRVANRGLGSVTARTSTWSADGNYVALACATNARLDIFEFNPTLPESQALIPVAEGGEGVFDPNGPGFSSLGGWSPDGRYLVVSDIVLDEIFVFEVLDSPSNNIVSGNMVSCNSGGVLSTGIGVLANSIDNMVLRNTSFNNPLSSNSTLDLFENYVYVTNVFEQRFGDVPTQLQNLQENTNVVHEFPEDIQLHLIRSISKACDIQTKLDILLTLYG